jgi:hypothetical protein
MSTIPHHSTSATTGTQIAPVKRFMVAACQTAPSHTLRTEAGGAAVALGVEDEVKDGVEEAEGV